MRIPIRIVRLILFISAVITTIRLGLEEAETLSAKLDSAVIEQILNVPKDSLKVLHAVEQGTRSHYFVPVTYLCKITKMKESSVKHHLSEIHRRKFVFHNKKVYDGYRLTYRGLDALALLALVRHDIVRSFGPIIGKGKESDVYMGCGRDNKLIVIKVHRLGRISFMKAREKRDYTSERSNWLLVSNIAAAKEYANLRALYGCGFPVPCPIDRNRHMVVMEYKAQKLLNNVHTLSKPRATFRAIMGIVCRLREHGLVHGDLNEFNLLVDPVSSNVTVIDFPQMISIRHPEAHAWLTRDIDGVCKFFQKRFDRSFDKSLSETALFQAGLINGSFDTSGEGNKPQLDRILRLTGSRESPKDMNDPDVLYQRFRKETLAYDTAQAMGILREEGKRDLDRYAYAIH